MRHRLQYTTYCITQPAVSSAEQDQHSSQPHLPCIQVPGCRRGPDTDARIKPHTRSCRDLLLLVATDFSPFTRSHPSACSACLIPTLSSPEPAHRGKVTLGEAYLHAFGRRGNITHETFYAYDQRQSDPVTHQKQEPDVGFCTFRLSPLALDPDFKRGSLRGICFESIAHIVASRHNTWESQNFTMVRPSIPHGSNHDY